ncbi:MAG TPA: NrsF family protein [Stellaceae bacterium]|nr:NrsF family protein [Stellaceae bacterium]
MISTQDLVEALAADAVPVRRLRRPNARALLWLFSASLIALLLGLLHGMRPDLIERLQERDFVIELAASFVTGITASIAAFYVSLPDRPAAWLLLPLPSLGLWASGMGLGCLRDWIAFIEGVPLPPDRLHCLMMIVAMSLAMVVSLVILLRHARALRLTATAGAAMLAIAGLVATALRLAEDIDGTSIVLLWNAGLFAVIMIAGHKSTLTRR